MLKAPSLLQTLCVILSCNCASGFQVTTPVTMPASMQVDVSIPESLKVNQDDISTLNDLVTLTPLAAAQLSAQIKYFQMSIAEHYRLGRLEGEITVRALTAQYRHLEQQLIVKERTRLAPYVTVALTGLVIGAVFSIGLEK